MGVGEAVIAQARANIEAQNARIGFAVWPENWHAVLTFVGMATQWRWVVGTKKALRAGLIYESLEEVRHAVRQRVPRAVRKRRGELLEQLQVMEDAVLVEQQKA